MKVLIVHNAYRFRGGEDAVVERETRLLGQGGVTVDTWLVDNESLQESRPLTTARNAIWNMDAFHAMQSRLRDFRPDVVHVHNVHSVLSPSILWACHDAGVPVVQTLHNYRLAGCISGLAHREARPCTACIGTRSPFMGAWHACYRSSRAASGVATASMLFHRQKQTYAEAVTHFISPSETVKDMTVRGGIAPDRITVLPHFVDALSEGPEAPDDSILFVGRLVPEKGIRTLMEAWEHFDQPARLHIAGTGPLAPEVAEWASHQPRVEVLGELSFPEVQLRMRHARLTVIPSEWLEPFGLTAIESLRMGTPIVTSDAGGVAEIGAASPAAATFAAGNPESLSRTLSQMFGWASKAELRQAAFDHAAATYGPEKHLADLCAVYRKVVHP